MAEASLRGVLLVTGMVLGGGLLAAGTLTIRHASSTAATPERVSLQQRQAQAGTCEGYNLELASAAAMQARLNRPEEAARLLAMRQACGAGTSAAVRSAR